MNKQTPSRTSLQAWWALYGRAALGLCVFALFLHDIFGAHGYLAMRRTKEDIERVRGELARLDKENGELAEEVHALKTDPQKIESMARGLGLAKPGEIIIKIPQPQRPAN